MIQTVIIMGVAGSGKSTIGKLLAKEIGHRFIDADDFHPESNKQKMASGIPLSDEDRLPWLKILHQEISLHTQTVLACSALKSAYRSILDPKQTCSWVFLAGSPELIFERLKNRGGHFMKPAMLESQLQTLESPQDVITIDIRQQPAQIVKEIIAQL